jgi:uncharacterized membrane protein
MVILKRVSLGEDNKNKNRVILITSIIFAASYSFKAVELFVTLSTVSYYFKGIFDTWFGLYLFLYNQCIFFDLLTIFVQVYFNIQHLKEMETKIDLKASQRAHMINTLGNSTKTWDSDILTERSESFFGDDMLD